MKKISLKNLDLEEVEQLTREQLRDVLGGWTGGTGETESTKDSCNCNTKDECSDGQTCDNCGSNGEGGKKWGTCSNG